MREQKTTHVNSSRNSLNWISNSCSIDAEGKGCGAPKRLAGKNGCKGEVSSP